MAFKDISGSHSDATRIKFEEAGQKVEGKLVAASKINTRDGDSFNKYVVESDGEMKTFLGCYQLDQVLPHVPLGTLIRVVYKGKEKIKGGKSVKNFQILADQDSPPSMIH